MFHSRKIGAWLILSLFGLGAITISFFLVSGIFNDFLNSAILFNQNIYSKYSYTNPIRFLNFGNYVISGLKISDPMWWNFQLMKPFVETYQQVDSWFFTGGLFRLSVLVVSLVFLLKRYYKISLFIYFFSCATLVIKEWEFRAQPFVIISIFILIFGFFSEFSKFNRNRFLKFFQVFSGSILFLSLFWLLIRISIVSVENYETQSYRTQLTGVQISNIEFKSISCNLQGVKLGYYPAGLYNYWLSDFKPLSKYLFLWPWNAEIGLHEVIEKMKQQDQNIIIVREDFVIWGLFDTKIYLDEMDEYLNANYHQITESIYISPHLYESCY